MQMGIDALSFTILIFHYNHYGIRGERRKKNKTIKTIIWQVPDYNVQ